MPIKRRPKISKAYLLCVPRISPPTFFGVSTTSVIFFQNIFERINFLHVHGPERGQFLLLYLNTRSMRNFGSMLLMPRRQAWNLAAAAASALWCRGRRRIVLRKDLLDAASGVPRRPLLAARAGGAAGIFSFLKAPKFLEKSEEKEAAAGEEDGGDEGAGDTIKVTFGEGGEESEKARRFHALPMLIIVSNCRNENCTCPLLGFMKLLPSM